MSQSGKPSPDSPQAAARALGLKAPGGMLTWAVLVDLAVDRYWEKRSRPLSKRRKVKTVRAA